MPERLAPAKINLALAVTGRRGDGYHLIESLVVFTRFGDLVAAEPADSDSFAVEGPFAAALSAQPESDNLVVRARDGLRSLARGHGVPAGPVALRLVKNLPVASGIGGGSADAAATLALLAEVWGFRPEGGALEALALRLGADVPMCLAQVPLMARGIGESIERLSPFPSLCLVMANPGVAVSTRAIFAALPSRDNPPLAAPPAAPDARSLGLWLGPARNDLLAPALVLAPEIGTCLAALAETGPLSTGMSGSGATCFALYGSTAEAEAAAARLADAYPDWFVRATETTAA